MSFVDRQDAGQQLAARLTQFKDSDVIVIGIPRGGVVIGAEIATALGAPMSVVLVRKISDQHHAEYAIGAISEKGTPIYDVRAAAEVGQGYISEAEDSARQLIKRRREIYFGKNFKRPSLKHKTVILVDDGIATGFTMRAAVQALQEEHPDRIFIAVPTAAADSLAIIAAQVDGTIVLEDPNEFRGAVGAHYLNFDEVTDDEVRDILHSHKPKQ